jgi:hypothetical protein
MALVGALNAIAIIHDAAPCLFIIITQATVSMTGPVTFFAPGGVVVGWCLATFWHLHRHFEAFGTFKLVVIEGKLHCLLLQGMGMPPQGGLHEWHQIFQ